MTEFDNIDSYLIGKNAKHNWKLLDQAGKHDILFHLSSFPSCYVILPSRGEHKVSKTIIKKCAEICKQNTKFKNLKNIGVDYTVCSNVKKGDVVGELIYISNRKVNKINV